MTPEYEYIDAVLEKANRLLEDGKPADSLRCLDEVEEHIFDADDRIECTALRACALSEMGQHDNALTALQRVIEEFPESARLFEALGLVLSNRNDLEPAREALETAMRLDPDDATLVANLALVYERMRDYSTAGRLYDRALALGADLDWTLLRQAMLHLEGGRSETARQYLRRYLSLVPEDAAQWISLAILLSDEGDYEEAFTCYREAERLDPQVPTLRLNWGVSAVRAGDFSAAREQLAHLQRVDPASSRPLLLEAFLLEEEDDMRAALRSYMDALAHVRTEEQADLIYTFEMAMDFFARQKLRPRAERLFRRAYAVNACTVELCGPYRELTGRLCEQGYWFCVVLEADYRRGLEEVHEHQTPSARKPRPRRYQRSFQVVAGDRDEAIALLRQLAERLGETNVVVCEFVREEPVQNEYTGLYELERESLILSEPPTAD